MKRFGVLDCWFGQKKTFEDGFFFGLGKLLWAFCTIFVHFIDSLIKHEKNQQMNELLLPWNTQCRKKIVMFPCWHPSNHAISVNSTTSAFWADTAQAFNFTSVKKSCGNHIVVFSAAAHSFRKSRFGDVWKWWVYVVIFFSAWFLSKIF